MVAVARAAVAGLMMVTARITDPALTPAVFNHWYTDIHVRDMISNNFATIALRYENYTVNSHAVSPTLSPASQYLALYNVPDVNFFSNPSTMDKLPLTSDILPDKTKNVMTWSAWVFTFWLHTQTHEGKSTSTERPKYVVSVKLEPGKATEDDVDQWYKKELLDKLALLPGYRRTTRYKSSDGSKPRFLALHEVDSLDIFMGAGDLFGSEWSKKIRGGAVTFEVSTWQLFVQKGNPTEKLGN